MKKKLDYWVHEREARLMHENGVLYMGEKDAPTFEEYINALKEFWEGQGRSFYLIKEGEEINHLDPSPMQSYSYRMIDMSKQSKKAKLEMRVYQIWLGYYNLGQGYDGSSKPEMVGKIRASSFKIACVLYEHQSAIDSLKDQMKRGDTYIEDIHFGVWYYEPKTNSNSWTRKYYETKAEAQETFK